MTNQSRWNCFPLIAPCAILILTSFLAQVAHPQSASFYVSANGNVKYDSVPVYRASDGATLTTASVNLSEARANPFNLGVYGANYYSPLDGNPVYGWTTLSYAQWSDVLEVTTTGLHPDWLRIHYDLHGYMNVDYAPVENPPAGNQYAGAGVTVGGSGYFRDTAYYSESISWEVRPGGVQFSSPFEYTTTADGGLEFLGSSYFDVAVDYNTGISNRGFHNFTLGLDAVAQTSGYAGSSVVVDFSNTLRLTTITLRDGTSLADVGVTVLFESQRVPEPASFVLIAIAGFLALVVRRRWN